MRTTTGALIFYAAGLLISCKSVQEQGSKIAYFDLQPPFNDIDVPSRDAIQLATAIFDDSIVIIQHSDIHTTFIYSKGMWKECKFPESMFDEYGPNFTIKVEAQDHYLLEYEYTTGFRIRMSRMNVESCSIAHVQDVNFRFGVYPPELVVPIFMDSSLKVFISQYGYVTQIGDTISVTKELHWNFVDNKLYKDSELEQKLITYNTEHGDTLVCRELMFVKEPYFVFKKNFGDLLILDSATHTKFIIDSSEKLILNVSTAGISYLEALPIGYRVNLFKFE